MALTSLAVKQAQPAGKTKRLYDERGLYLEISPAGGKWWRLKYRFAGKEKRLSLGVYPDISLKEARAARDEARRLIAQGVDPSARRKEISRQRVVDAENSFEVVAREWFQKQAPIWSDIHQKNVISKLEKNIFPYLGHDTVAAVSAPNLLRVLRKIEERGAIETAHRTLSICGQVFRYAIATARAEREAHRQAQAETWRPVQAGGRGLPYPRRRSRTRRSRTRRTRRRRRSSCKRFGAAPTIVRRLPSDGRKRRRSRQRRRACKRFGAATPIVRCSPPLRPRATSFRTPMVTTNTPTWWYRSLAAPSRRTSVS